MQGTAASWLSLALQAPVLALALVSCSLLSRPSPPVPEPEPAPGMVFLHNSLPDSTLRERLLAGGHPAPANMRMRLRVALFALHEDALNRRLAAINDLNSSFFGKRLSEEEMKSYMRPASDYEAIEDWFGTYGIRVVDTDRSPFVTILAEGTAAQVEQALKTDIVQSADGKWYANTSYPQIPATLQGVVAGFLCLDNLMNYGAGPKFVC